MGSLAGEWWGLAGHTALYVGTLSGSAGLRMAQDTLCSAHLAIPPAVAAGLNEVILQLLKCTWCRCMAAVYVTVCTITEGV